MGTIPESDASLSEQVGDGHHGRADDPKCMFNAMHLQRFDKGFFGRHFHGMSPESILDVARFWPETSQMTSPGLGPKQ